MALPKLTAELYLLYEKEEYEKCQSIMPLVKLELIKNNLLVPNASNTANGDQLSDLKIAQRILEIGALSALLSHQHAGFENNYAQLRSFYACPALHPDPELDTETTKVISLYLLYLLSQGQVANFHVELEVLYNSKHYDTDPDKYLSFPISLERHLMEGNYIKVWRLLKDELALPCKEYGHFIDTLVNALRYEIARSLEKTYTHMPVSNCKSLLYYPQEQLDALFETNLRSELNVDSWRIEKNVVYFGKSEGDAYFDGTTTIVNVLSYAEQLESIV